MTADAGLLTVTIDDDRLAITLAGRGQWQLPLGPATLHDRELERADPPNPVHLTNALAAVRDHFDDIVIEEPAVLTPSAVVVEGVHARGVALVETGRTTVPTGYRLRRADAEEVFRTLVSEPVADRRANPGLPADQVETVIGALCVILAIMRRLDLAEVAIAVDSDATSDPVER